MKNKPISLFVLIIPAIVLLIMVFSSFFNLDKYIPGFSEIIPSLWILFIIIDIYKSSKYLKNKPKNEIRIRSNNDTFGSLFPFIGGAFILFYSILFLFLDGLKSDAILLSITGIILIIKGLVFIPGALIKIDFGILNLQNGKISDSIKIETIEEIVLNDGNIEFILLDGEKYIFSHLEMNQKDIENVKSFFKEYIERNIACGFSNHL